MLRLIGDATLAGVAAIAFSLDATGVAEPTTSANRSPVANASGLHPDMIPDPGGHRNRMVTTVDSIKWGQQQ